MDIRDIITSAPARQAFDQLPVVDLSPLSDGDLEAVASPIRDALQSSGFFYLSSHGVDPALTARTFACAEQFFSLPLGQKAALSIRQSGMAFRGYTELRGENTDMGDLEDEKESFDIGPERSVFEGPFFGPNQWPDALPGFQETLREYLGQMTATARALLKAIAVSLDLDAEYFEARMIRPSAILRMLHYPPRLKRDGAPSVGVAPHTDYGLLTLLAQDGIGGLQVLSPDGRWIDAPPIPGTLVVNIGDITQRLTNGRYIANQHRVFGAQDRSRYSLPFFFDMDLETVVSPLPSCTGPDNPPRYPPVTCGEHKLARYAGTFDHLS